MQVSVGNESKMCQNSQKKQTAQAKVFVPEVLESKDGPFESSLIGLRNLINGRHLKANLAGDFLEIVLWTLMTLSDVVDGCQI